MFIVLEGLDGAGKTTQIKLIQELFESRGDKVNFLHFPRFETSLYGELIAKFLRGDFGNIEDVHPMLVALLFAEDRREAAPQLREWLERGEIVLLDRYFYSNIAFQCAKVENEVEAEKLREWIFFTEVDYHGLPIPDHTLFLDVPLNLIAERLRRGRVGDDRQYLKGKDDIHEIDLNYQNRVRHYYLKECTTYKTLKRVECCDPFGGVLPAEEVFQMIKSKLAL